MTSLPAQPQYKGGPGEYIILFFVFTDWFVWSMHSGKSTVFSLLSCRALARRLRSVWIRVLVIWHQMTHTIFASFVWARSTHAMSLRGKSACTVSFFKCFYYLQERGAAVCFGTQRCRGTESNEIVGFAVGYGRWVREGPPPFHARRLKTKVSCWIVTMRSFWHHQIQRLVLCWVMPRKSRRCLRARKLRLNPLNPTALHMTSYWRLWTIK